MQLRIQWRLLGGVLRGAGLFRGVPDEARERLSDTVVLWLGEGAGAVHPCGPDLSLSTKRDR